jgi:ABC-type Fe3+ transport system permease subunit
MKSQNSWQTWDRGDEPPTPTTPDAQPPKKKRRIFMWTFLVIQAVFLLWIILGVRSGAGTPDDCGTLSKVSCNEAENTGTAIAVGLIVALWAAVDIILGISYAIYRIARRR